MHDLIGKHSWADEELDLAWTVAVIEGKTEDDVIRAYGGDPAQPVGSLTFREAWVPEGDFGKYFYLQILRQGLYVVAIENNGWSGDVPEIACRTSKDGGRFFSVYWGGNGVHQIGQAIDGKMVAYLELMTGSPSYDVNDLIPSWIHGVDYEVDHLRATCLAYLEQQTGLAFDRAWLEEKLPTYRIPDPDAMLRDVENARQP